jgi:hypothetical protein
VLATTTGCAQLAGIEKTSGPPDPEPVSLTVNRLSVGATVASNPQDLTGNTASFLVPDDTVPEGFTRVPADLSPPNVWTAQIDDGTPPVQFDLPDVGVAYQRLWQFPNRDFIATFGVYEHPSPQPAPMAATLTVGWTLPTPYVTGQSFQIQAIGTWNARTFPAAELPLVDMGLTTVGPATFPMTAMTKLPGREYEKITTADAVVVTRHTGNRLSGVMEAAPFDQTGTDTIMGTMTAVPTDQMLTATLNQATVAPRYTPLRPGMGAPTMRWELIAAPGIDVGASRGFSLHSGAVALVDPPLSVAFGNPFVAKGWRSLFLFATASSRTYTAPGPALPVTLRAELYTYTEPTPGMSMMLPAGLPELISIDGMPLSTDGLSIAKPTQQVHVTFVAGGAGDVYGVQLYELAPNTAGTALEYRPVIEVLGPTKDLLVPPDVFVPGKLYTLRALVYAGGFPNVATGDLSRGFPISHGSHDSGVFTVTP